MESLKELYKIGVGPSSSHTIAPSRALKMFDTQYSFTDRYVIELYGSLSLTGKGHFTDVVLKQTVDKPVEVIFKLEWKYPFDNGLIIKGYQADEKVDQWVVYSLGGGSIRILDYPTDFQKQVYYLNTYSEIKQYCKHKQIDLVQFVLEHEPDILDYMEKIVDAMVISVKQGLKAKGKLLGPFNMPRIAGQLLENLANQSEKKCMAYAYAVMEQNATIQTVVTAPTCGSAGVLASVIYYCLHDLGFSREDVKKALVVGGVFGNLIKKNSTISGAQGGCQAEVGSACSMAAAAYAYLLGLCLNGIEQAAEIAMEHHLGLTCDPVGGYVIIPCIERNAIASIRAIDAALLAKSLGGLKTGRVSFDQVINTMNYTGKRLPLELRETSLGGLAIENIPFEDC